MALACRRWFLATTEAAVAVCPRRPGWWPPRPRSWWRGGGAGWRFGLAADVGAAAREHALTSVRAARVPQNAGTSCSTRSSPAGRSRRTSAAPPASPRSARPPRPPRSAWVSGRTGPPSPCGGPARRAPRTGC
ncbi:hypothetical protein HBB16_21195 [Pseudonocardia sp. MCCB 268]|nr:hypothetical protein [Pseudonocardia cytotoxica]